MSAGTPMRRSGVARTGPYSSVLELAEARRRLLGLDRAGRHGVHRHAVLREFERDTAGKTVDAGLGGGIGGVADVVGRPRRAFARAGAEIDDAAIAAFAHVRRGLARAQEGRAQVEPQDEVPVLDLGLPDVARRSAAHVVDQDVEPAVRLERRGEQRFDRRLLGDVGGDGHHRPSGCLDLPLGLGEPAASMSASTSEAPSSLSLQRDGAAQSGRCAGHQRDLVGHPACRHCPLPLAISWQVRHACRMASISQDENGSVDRMVEAKAAIVTGGAGGIGKSTVRRLLDSGLSVFVVDANQGALDALRSEFAGSADRLEVWHADVTDERQTIDAVSRANERFGGVYALVHIAGGAGPKRARDIEDFLLQDWTMSSTSI